MSFDPCNQPLKIQESTETPTPKVELPWGVRVHSLTPSHTLGSMLCDSRLPSWPATLQTLTLVMSPRLGLQQYSYSYFFVLYEHIDHDLCENPFVQILTFIPSPFRISSSPCCCPWITKGKTTKFIKITLQTW